MWSSKLLLNCTVDNLDPESGSLKKRIFDRLHLSRLSFPSLYSLRHLFNFRLIDLSTLSLTFLSKLSHLTTLDQSLSLLDHSEGTLLKTLKDWDLLGAPGWLLQKTRSLSLSADLYFPSITGNSVPDILQEYLN